VSLRVIRRLGMADIPSWARVGAKVVCINDRQQEFDPSSLKWDALDAGQVYTISGVWGGLGAGARIMLAGSQVRFGFYVRRFRPLVTDEQKAADLALFKSWLPHNETEPA
jgi:hypothetical protein